jgi:hypothetical protein
VVVSVVGGVAGVEELWVAVGVALCEGDAEDEGGVEFVCLDGDSEGLLLGEELSEGQSGGVGVADFDGSELGDPDGSPPL